MLLQRSQAAMYAQEVGLRERTTKAAEGIGATVGHGPRPSEMTGKLRGNVRGCGGSARRGSLPYVECRG